MSIKLKNLINEIDSKSFKVIDLNLPEDSDDQDYIEIAIDPDPNDSGKAEADTWRQIDIDDFLMEPGIDGDYGEFLNMSVDQKLLYLNDYLKGYIKQFKKLPPISQGS
jgi:hypothetical protein